MKRKLLAFFLLIITGAFAQIPVEGFESPTFPPPGWLALNNGIGPACQWNQTGLGNPAQVPYQGDYAAWCNKETVASGLAEDWLVTPSFAVPANGQLSFYSRLSIPGDQGSIYKIMLTTGDPQDLNNYTLLQQWTEEEINPQYAVYTQKIVEIPSVYTGQEVRLAFVMINNNGDRWFIDNVSILQGCPAPVNLVVSNIGETSFDVSWTPQGDASQFEIVIMPIDEPFTGAEPGYITSTSIFTFDGLDLTEGYKVYVRSICNSGDASIWTGPLIIGTFSGNTLEGVVTFDADGDTNCDVANTVAFMEIEVSIDGVFAYTTYTNMLGEYHIYNLPDGESTVTLQPVSSSIFAPIDAIVVPVNFTDEVDEQTQDICLSQPGDLNDISVTIFPSTPPQAGFDTMYYVIVSNYGSQVIDNLTATVTFDDERQSYVSSNGGSTVSGNAITFNFGTVAAFSTSVQSFTLNTSPPPVNVGGEQLVLNAVLSENPGDANPADNEAVLYQTIVNSWDPNDITVHEGAEITPEQAEGYLTYTIRFENTGTAPAVNIRVDSELDAKFDPESIQVINASHEYSVVRNDDMVQFYFNGISLPPSEDGSMDGHGYITYRIKPVDNVQLGDVFEADAGIFFDFNEPVLTNTATTEIVQEVAGVADFNRNKVAIYPNPVNDLLSIETQDAELSSVTIYDLNGRKCITGTTTVINVASLKQGLYFAEITTDAGTSVFKLVKQ